MKLQKSILLYFTLILVCFAFTSCSTKKSLIISPTLVDKSADQLSDSEIISMLEDPLYSNGAIVLDWFYVGVGLERDEASVFESEDFKNANYVLVKNIGNMKELKANLQTVFSNKLLESFVYPRFFDCDNPFFVENGKKLYYNANTGGAAAFAPDFTRARVTSRSENSFEIEVPMTTVDDQDGEPFLYKAVQQNNNWVLDSFYYFKSKD